MRTETRYIQTHRGLDDDEAAERKVTTVEDERLDGTLKAANVVYTIAGILIGLIGLRFILLLLGANAANPIAQIIYGLTQPFVLPFYGLFGTPYAIEGVRFEVESVIAILFLGLLSWAIVRLLTVARPSQI
jgi:hypothetical protein